MMRKLIPLIFLLILIGFATTPYFVGKKFQDQYDQSIAQLNKTYAGKVTVKGTFEHGFLSSSATTEIRFANIPEPLILKHTIYNGPAIFEFDGAGKMSSYIPKGFKLAVVKTTIDSANLNTVIKNVYKDKPAYTIISDFKFDGSGTTTVTNFPLTMSLGVGDVNWKGMTLSIQHAKNFASVSAMLSMPEFSYSEMTADMAKKNELRIADLKANYTSGAGLTNETLDFSLASISLTEGGLSVFNADKITIKGSGAKTNQIIKSDLTYGFNKISIAQDSYGPMSLKVKMDNIDLGLIDVLSSKVAADRDLAKSHPSPRQLLHVFHTYLTDEQIRAALILMPSFDIELSLTTPRGKLDYVNKFTIGSKDLKEITYAGVLATLNGDITYSISQEFLYALLSQVAEGDIRQNEKIFATTNQDPNLLNPYTLTPQEMQPVIENWIITLLDRLKDKKYIVEKDKVISADIKISNGVVTVNGKQVHSEDLEAVSQWFTIKLTPKLKPAPKVVPAVTPAAPQQAPIANPAAPATTPAATTAVTPTAAPVVPDTTNTPNAAPANPNASIQPAADADAAKSTAEDAQDNSKK